MGICGLAVFIVGNYKHLRTTFVEYFTGLLTYRLYVYIINIYNRYGNYT